MCKLALLIAISLTAAACGSAGPAAGPPVEVELAAGGSVVSQVVIEGTTVDYVVVVPEGFTPGDTAPVLLALPPGGQDIAIATSVTGDVYQTEALARGWVVVSPAAPRGELFFRGSESLIPGLLDFIETWVSPEGGGFHLSGISNGGISSFRVAAADPDRFLSITVFPGFPTTDSDVAALESLTSIPVHLFVGELDQGWVVPMQDTADRLAELGGDVSFEVFPGAGHFIGALSDGLRVFDELDAAR